MKTRLPLGLFLTPAMLLMMLAVAHGDVVNRHKDKDKDIDVFASSTITGTVNGQ
jgi:hypothetical protein